MESGVWHKKLFSFPFALRRGGRAAAGVVIPFVIPATEPGSRSLCRAHCARTFLLPGPRVKPGVTILLPLFLLPCRVSPDTPSSMKGIFYSPIPLRHAKGWRAQRAGVVIVLGQPHDTFCRRSIIPLPHVHHQHRAQSKYSIFRHLRLLCVIRVMEH